MAYADYLTLGPERFLAGGENDPVPVSDHPEDPCVGQGDGVRCRAGKCSFWITWQGNILPCGMFPTETNLNVFRDAFPVAWEQVKKDTAAIRLPGQCAACSAKDSCHTCAAMVITESGSFQKLPQYRCDMIRAYKAQWDRVKEEML